jgi:hypothetical protein
MVGGGAQSPVSPIRSHSMSLDVFVQLTLLSEPRGAYLTDEWLLTSVDPKMIFEVAFLVERLGSLA